MARDSRLLLTARWPHSRAKQAAHWQSYDARRSRPRAGAFARVLADVRAAIPELIRTTTRRFTQRGLIRTFMRLPWDASRCLFSRPKAKYPTISGWSAKMLPRRRQTSCTIKTARPDGLRIQAALIQGLDRPTDATQNGSTTLGFPPVRYFRWFCRKGWKPCSNGLGSSP